MHISPKQDSSSLASTETLSSVSSQEHLSRWPPGPFPIPAFSFDLELKLREGNTEFEKNGRPLKLTRDLKHSILQKLACTMYGFKAYPSDKEMAMAAEALVEKNPCLREAGSQTGWYGWKNSIKFKMGNYRSKMRQAGFQEVTVNAGKRSKGPLTMNLHTQTLKDPSEQKSTFYPTFPKEKIPQVLSA